VISDSQRLKAMGIPRHLFRLTSAFENFQIDSYQTRYLPEPNSSTVKFVDEPADIIDFDDDTRPLINSAKSSALWGGGVSQLTRRMTPSSTRQSTQSSPYIPAVVPSTRGPFHMLMETLFPTVLDIPEPNDHTFDDHYRMTSQELDVEDALEPLHDEMMLRKAWLILELMPMKRMWQERGRWKSTFW
jgi:hypothetical protein